MSGGRPVDARHGVKVHNPFRSNGLVNQLPYRQRQACDKRSAKQDGVSGLALSREGCRNWSAQAGRVLPAPTLPQQSAKRTAAFYPLAYAKLRKTTPTGRNTTASIRHFDAYWTLDYVWMRLVTQGCANWTEHDATYPVFIRHLYAIYTLGAHQGFRSEPCHQKTRIRSRPVRISGEAMTLHG